MLGEISGCRRQKEDFLARAQISEKVCFFGLRAHHNLLQGTWIGQLSACPVFNNGMRQQFTNEVIKVYIRTE